MSTNKGVTASTDTAAENLPAQTTQDATMQPATGRSGIEINSMDDLTNVVEMAKSAPSPAALAVGTVNLKMQYRSFEIAGEVIRRSFLGFTLKMSVDPVTGEEKGLIPAVQLYDHETETIEVCMQTVLVGVLHEVGYPKGAPLQITYKGDKRGKSGLKYQDFDIRALVAQK